MTSLHLHTEIRGDRVAVTVIGELDAHTAPSFEDFVAAVPVRADVIDARYVTFVGAAGLRALLAARARSDCALVPSAMVARLAAVAGIDVALCDEPFGPPWLDHADFAVAVHDANLRFHYVNPRLAEINGLPVARHTGKLLREVFDVESDDVTDVLLDVLRRRAPIEVTVAGETASGSPDFWTCNYHPVRWLLGDEVVRQIVGVVQPASPTDTALSFAFSAPSGPAA